MQGGVGAAVTGQCYPCSSWVPPRVESSCCFYWIHVTREIAWVRVTEQVLLKSKVRKATSGLTRLYHIKIRFVCHLLFSVLGLAYASGLAATLNITHLLKAGDMIICMDDVYGGMQSTSIVLIFIVQMIQCTYLWFLWTFQISHVGPYFSVKSFHFMRTQNPPVWFGGRNQNTEWFCGTEFKGSKNIVN